LKHVERARAILAQTLPPIRDYDDAMNSLFYVDSTNALTRMHATAAAIWILDHAYPSRQG
jgi:hypothetical protein